MKKQKNNRSTKKRKEPQNRSFIGVFIGFYFLAFLSVMMLLPGFNILVDRYGVFAVLSDKPLALWADNKSKGKALSSKPQVRYDYLHNDRFIQAHYLMSHSGEYQHLVIGNSKLHVYDTSLLDKGIFRMSYNGGNLNEHIHNTSLISEAMCGDRAACLLRSVTLALDLGVFFEKETPLASNHNKRLYPMTLTDKLDFAKQYLFKAPDEKDFLMYAGQGYEKTQDKVLFTGRGALIDTLKNSKPLKEERLVERSPTDDQINRVMGQLKKLQSELNRRGVRLLVFLQPMHPKNIARYQEKDLIKMKVALKELDRFKDFTVVPGSSKDENWFESVHFTQALSVKPLAWLGKMLTNESLSAKKKSIIQMR